MRTFHLSLMLVALWALYGCAISTRATRDQKRECLVEVRGAVGYPGFHPCGPNLATVGQLVKLASGYDPCNQIYLVRKVNGQLKEFQVNLNHPVQDGDGIIVRHQEF